MNHLVFVQEVLKTLNARYGTTIQYYKATSNSVNLATGVPTRQYTVLEIKKAVLLPLRQFRDFQYDIGYLAANKNFTYGAEYDKNLFWSMFELTIEPNLNDMIVNQGTKYQIREYHRFYEDVYEMVLHVPKNDNNEKFLFAENFIEFRGTA